MTSEPTNMDGNGDQPGGSRDKDLRAPWKAMLVVLIVALAVRGIALYEMRQAPTFTTPIIDAQVYHDWAAQLAVGPAAKPFEEKAYWQPPLFPLFLGAVYSLVGVDVAIARIVMIMVGSVSCALLTLFGCQIDGSRVGWLAGLILALYGPFVFFGTQLLPVGLAILLLLTALTLWSRAIRSGAIPFWIASGVATGLAAITVPNCGLVAIPVLAERLWRCRRGRSTTGRAIPAAAVFALASAVPVGAVSIRNYAVSGEFVLISTNGGINFYIGNNEQADETVAIRPGEHWRRLTRESLQDQDRTPGKQSDFYLQKSWRYIKTDPLGFLAGLARKSLRVVNGREIPRNVDPYVQREFSVVLALLMWRLGSFAFPLGLIAPLAVVGTICGNADRSRRLHHRLIVIIVILYALSVVMFFVSSRHRMPVIPLVVLLAAIGIWEFPRLFATGKASLIVNRLRVRGTVGFVIAALMVNLPVQAPNDGHDFKTEMLLSVGVLRLSDGDVEKGEDLLRAALAEDPGVALTHTKLGLTLARRGDWDNAEEHLRQAARLDPLAAEPRYLLAEVMRDRGKPDHAAAWYQAALTLDPFSAPIHGSYADFLLQRGEFESAIEHYRHALRFSDAVAVLWIGLADALVQAGKYKEAMTAYQRGLNASEVLKTPALLDRIARLYATCPKVELRDCDYATELAEFACRATALQEPDYFHTLAAAYAACNRIPDAIAAVEHAVELARQQGRGELLEQLDSSLRLYQSRRARP